MLTTNKKLLLLNHYDGDCKELSCVEWRDNYLYFYDGIKGSNIRLDFKDKKRYLRWVSFTDGILAINDSKENLYLKLNTEDLYLSIFRGTCRITDVIGFTISCIDKSKKIEIINSLILDIKLFYSYLGVILNYKEDYS